jgi:hypothetical protein
MNMSSKPMRSESTDAEVSHAEAEELPVENSACDEEIRCRAYEIYLERGQQAGGELDDWLQAERELEGAALWRVQAD